ncbi:hypothetical protein ABZS83_17800 [Streptomyces sp. NPDC005426]|uniref:hypothetical protein n=1 Tax=Streptomyces sp. NPDC005426 TaxID=3155344 RepID=UPI00339FC585
MRADRGLGCRRSNRETWRGWPGRRRAAGGGPHRGHRAALGEITARLYTDLPAEDLAAAQGLTEVTARADAVLAEG